MQIAVLIGYFAHTIKLILRFQSSQLAMLDANQSMHAIHGKLIMARQVCRSVQRFRMSFFDCASFSTQILSAGKVLGVWGCDLDAYL